MKITPFACRVIPLPLRRITNCLRRANGSMMLDGGITNAAERARLFASLLMRASPFACRVIPFGYEGFAVRLDGKSTIWRLRQLFTGKAMTVFDPQVRTSAGVSPLYSSEAYLIDAKLCERSRQAERVFSVEPFLVLFGAPKSTEEKDIRKQQRILKITPFACRVIPLHFRRISNCLRRAKGSMMLDGGIANAAERAVFSVKPFLVFVYWAPTEAKPFS